MIYVTGQKLDNAMKDILLKETGEINEEWLNEYISSHDINKPFTKTRHTLLYAVVTNDEISPDKKLELASYLINKGARVNTELEKRGETVNIALKKNNPDLANLLSKEEIKHRFDGFGLIKSDDTALVLAAKMSKKPYKNSIFVINNPDVTLLTEQIKALIEKDTDTNIIKFQIIHFHQNHAIFGEFKIDKTLEPPVVTYLHCDPAGGDVGEYSEIISDDFIESIAPLATIQVYDSAVNIQKTRGCSYFSIDGAMMLAAPADRPYFSNVIEHIEQTCEKTEHGDHKNIKYIKSFSLPPRFIRGLQFDGKEDALKKTTLLSFFNTVEKDTVVNKKGETAEEAMDKDLKKIASKLNPDETRTFNYRAERKMKQYGTAVVNFIDDKNLFDPEFINLVDQYKIKGLKQFCEEIIEHKKEQSISI